ncbi:DNA-formamidopyrimidine glycosylase family protein [uncultured Microbacterium sp.]|uniref:Fpg/Nei family DNA glycosylase n=1 Tax=uncultured Microbacterium sp. TaxID=191216 RepID=UPI0025E329A5|nr:DNA-formamidopyrimidine glycosylase family protein [uncultured Microbacterium sp.]
MPEMPEVEQLARFLAERTRGLSISSIRLGAIAALKTYDPSLDSLSGAVIEMVERHGKFVVIGVRDASATDSSALYLAFHLAKAGWLRWYEQVPTTLIRPGKTPIALRVTLSDGSGFDLTEAGTKKSLAVYVARDPGDVPGIARLGPDPLDPAFDEARFAALLSGRRTQIKGVLRDQSIIAGIGNAYSDEILHAARMSPYALAASLNDAEVKNLYAAMRDTLRAAIDEASGRPPADLKDAKRRGMSVHGRRGEACPVCGDTVRSVFFADK